MAEPPKVGDPLTLPDGTKAVITHVEVDGDNVGVFVAPEHPPYNGNVVGPNSPWPLKPKTATVSLPALNPNVDEVAELLARTVGAPPPGLVPNRAQRRAIQHRRR